MFAEKPTFPTSNPSKLRLPPIGHTLRQRLRTLPISSHPSVDENNDSSTDNMSELKAKYSDYTTWLKASTRQSRGPVVTQELLKNSLCQMGIDSVKAEQLVSTCSWYVYQFQKDLKTDSKSKDQLTPITGNQKANQHKNKSKKTPTRKYNPEDSTSTLTSIDKDDCLPSNALPPIRNPHLTLPTIHVSDLSTSSRFRHVDFNAEQTRNPLSNHWRSALVKTRIISTFQPLSSKESNLHSPLDLNLSSTSSYQRGLPAGHTRSILRKQTSSSSSATSTNVSSRKTCSRILTPSSAIIDDIPLGTRSQRLFGGSECFAQIMNELEEQTETI